LELATNDDPGRLKQAYGIVPLDPLPEEIAGYLNQQSIAIAADPEMYTLPKPQLESWFAQALRHHSAQGVFHPGRSILIASFKQWADLAKIYHHVLAPRTSSVRAPNYHSAHWRLWSVLR
jgi:hypothetical protein